MMQPTRAETKVGQLTTDTGIIGAKSLEISTSSAPYAR